jgi:hypothetical protein
MPSRASAQKPPASLLGILRRRERAPLSLVVGLFACNGLTWFGVGVLVGHTLQ